MAARLIGLVAHAGKPGATTFVARLVARLEATGDTAPMLESETAQLIHRTGRPLAEIAAEAGLLVVLGGDGSLLRAVHAVENTLPPVFGINLGSLGFLTCLSSLDPEAAADTLLAGRYVLSPRTLLAVRVERAGTTVASATALNEAVIGRGAHSHLVRLDAFVGGAFLTRYNADGLIVATPTGSTAYALSAGGPVLAPDAGTFVIAPVCPHVLTNRATVVPDTARIDIEVCAGEQEVLLTVDGRAVTGLKDNDRVTLTRSDRIVQLAMPEGVTFFDLLRQKLKWSGTNV